METGDCSLIWDRLMQLDIMMRNNKSDVKLGVHICMEGNHASQKFGKFKYFVKLNLMSVSLWTKKI